MIMVERLSKEVAQPVTARRFQQRTPMATDESLKFVIVGHLDHGKSTLIGRLLFDTNSLPQDKIEEIKKAYKVGADFICDKIEFAFLVDHLREEREQFMTIDTAQTFFNTDKRRYVIIDAPGHREFVKNMITGASQAEAAILIVDVKEGVNEQTRRHAYILSMLGIAQVIVVANKMDLVAYNEKRFNEVKAEIAKLLAGIGITASFYIPVSALYGDNVARPSDKMQWFKGHTILGALDSLTIKLPAEDKPLEVAPLIFPVQDVYKIDDKRIVVGRVETGTIRVGQEVKILPEGRVTKVKSIEKFLERVDTAHAQESIGITLEVAPPEEGLFLDRGQIICEPEHEPYLKDRFRANIFWMGDAGCSIDDELTLRCTTQETICRIEKINKRLDSSTLAVIEEDATCLKDLDVGEVIIKTLQPIAILPFNEVPELGRFVLVREVRPQEVRPQEVRPQGNIICAGGIITTIL